MRRRDDGCCNANVAIKYSFALSVLVLFLVGHTARNRRSTALSLTWQEGFSRKAKNERFPAVNLRCRQNLKYENVTWTFGRLGQFLTPKSVPQVQHDYFSSLNQSSHWFLVLLPSS